MALLTKIDEKMNVFGRNCMTLWNCRRIMTGKWLKIGEDEYDAPYPRVFSAVKEILEDRQGAFTIFSKVIGVARRLGHQAKKARLKRLTFCTLQLKRMWEEENM